MQEEGNGKSIHSPKKKRVIWWTENKTVMTMKKETSFKAKPLSYSDVAEDGAIKEPRSW